MSFRRQKLFDFFQRSRLRDSGGRPQPAAEDADRLAKENRTSHSQPSSELLLLAGSIERLRSTQPVERFSPAAACRRPKSHSFQPCKAFPVATTPLNQGDC